MLTLVVGEAARAGMVWISAGEFAMGSDQPNTNNSEALKRVNRGGSCLCHASYSESYRTAARRGTAYDSGAPHIGFRCVKNP